MTLVTKGFNVVELSSHGDCTIIIGSAPKTKVLKVSSHTLRDISSVFDERLGKSDQPQKTFSLELPTDDPDAIETILRIAHAKWQHTVEDPSKPLEELLQLVHVVDKYKVRLPLRQKFLDSWVRGAISGGYTEIGWSHVAWGFGYQEIYANVATTLILNTKISEGALATDAGPIHPGDLPEEMMSPFPLLPLFPRLISLKLNFHRKHHQDPRISLKSYPPDRLRYLHKLHHSRAVQAKRRTYSRLQRLGLWFSPQKFRATRTLGTRIFSNRRATST